MEVIGLWICIVLIAYSLAFAQMYSCYHFKSIQALLIVQKRYPKLVLIEAYAVIIYLLISVPFWENGNYDATHFGLSPDRFSIFKAITSNVIVVPVLHFIPILEISRLWLISYHLHYLHKSTQQQWKLQIDHSFSAKDWHLKNKTTYGNPKYILTRSLIYYTFVTVFLTTMNLTDHFAYAGNFAGVLHGVFFLIDIVFTFYMYFKCRKYDELNDNLLFHYELTATTIIWAICFGLFVIAQPFQYTGFHFISRSIVTVAAFLTYTAPSLLSTLWIPRKIVLIGLWNDDLLNNNNEITMHVINTYDDKTKNNGIETTVEQRLYETLKNEEKFNLFIQWMYREFSCESPLFFIESVQFKEYVVVFIENNMKKKTDCDYKYINLLYDNIPKSSIISAGNDACVVGNDIATFKIMAQSLFHKYIRSDAEFEVNIADNLRRKYIRFAQHNWSLDIDELVNVFDPVINEVFLFMRNSFVRYEKI